MRAATRLGLSLLALLLALGAYSPGTASTQRDNRLVLMYYVPDDPAAWASLQAHAEQIDVVAPQWVSVDACGHLASSDDHTLIDFAHANGIKVVPTLLTVSPWLNHQVLTDEATRQAALDAIVAYTVDLGFDGFDLDLEGIDASDRDAYSLFAAQAAEALHARGKLLTMAIPAKEHEMTVGWAGAYDYAALGAAADLVTVMAYEFRGAFSGPGSVAPFDWVARVARFTSSQMPPERALLGLAFYGWDWNLTSGQARLIGYPLAELHPDGQRFDPTDRSLTFSYTSVAGEVAPPESRAPDLQHRITIRQAPACDVRPPPSPTRVPSTPRPLPAPGTLEEHEVWLEESGSAAARLELVNRYGLRGVGAWRLGLEDPAVWQRFTDWRGAAP